MVEDEEMTTTKLEHLQWLSGLFLPTANLGSAGLAIGLPKKRCEWQSKGGSWFVKIGGVGLKIGSQDGYEV